MGRRFELRTDHNGLRYLFDQPTLNARQRRWLDFLCEYDFDIKHIKGKENKVVDALSKKVHELHATTIVITLKCTTEAYLASGQLMPLPSQSHVEQNLKKPLKSRNPCPNLSLGALDHLLVFYYTRVTAG
jgi:hypothetical protein